MPVWKEGEEGSVFVYAMAESMCATKFDMGTSVERLTDFVVLILTQDRPSF